MFDLGNVLIEWDPWRLFAQECIDEIDFFRWNAALDAGAPFAETVAEVRKRFPHWAEPLDAFRDRWHEILGGVNVEVMAIVEELRERGVRLFVLSNSSAETVPTSTDAVGALARFDDVLLSGEVGIVKPDPEIYLCARQRFELDPDRTWFVDDSQANVDAAASVGWRGIHFTTAAALRAQLSAAGLVQAGARSS